MPVARGAGKVSRETHTPRHVAADAGVSAETRAPTSLGPDADVSAETRTPRSDVDGGDVDGERAAAASNADALALMAETLLASGARTRNAAERFQVVVHVDTATLVDGDPAGRSELVDGPALPAETARRLACDADLVTIIERQGRPLSIGRKTRTISPPLRRAR